MTKNRITESMIKVSNWAATARSRVIGIGETVLDISKRIYNWQMWCAGFVLPLLKMGVVIALFRYSLIRFGVGLPLTYTGYASM